MKTGCNSLEHKGRFLDTGRWKLNEEMNATRAAKIPRSCHANQWKSVAEGAENSAGAPSAPAGRHRLRGWRPRTTRAKAGLAAVAAVGATGLALALVAGPAGASTKPAWAMTAGNVQTLSGVDPSTASYFFNTATAYGSGASLVKTPVPGPLRDHARPVLHLLRPVPGRPHQRGHHLPLQVGHVRPGELGRDPGQRQQDPVKYMTLFGQLAHANGLKVIQAPALDLATVTGSVLPRQAGESADQWFVRVNIAGKASAAGDIFQLQDESNTTAGGRYSYMYNTTASQAQAANASVKVFSEVSTVNGTAAQMATAAQSISPTVTTSRPRGTSRRPTSSSR